MNNPYLPLHRLYKGNPYAQRKEGNKADACYNCVEKERQVKSRFPPVSNYNWHNATAKSGSEYRERNATPYNGVDKGFREYCSKYETYNVKAYSKYQIDFNEFANRRRGVSAGERKCNDMELYFMTYNNNGVSKDKNINIINRYNGFW